MAQAPPSVSVTLALEPSVLRENEAVELSATIISHASAPITILAYATILDIREAQMRSRSSAKFQCIDLDTDTRVRLQDRVCGRWDNISHKLEDSDSQYFHTLEPEVPYTFRGPCFVPYRELVPGHKYHLTVDDEANIDWWRYGTKEEVLEAPGQRLPQYMLRSDGNPIDLTDTTPIEFSVPSNWKNIGGSVSADISSMRRARYKTKSDSPSVTATLAVNVTSL